jgi:hypothetical protein
MSMSAREHHGDHADANKDDADDGVSDDGNGYDDDDDDDNDDDDDDDDDDEGDPMPATEPPTVFAALVDFARGCLPDDVYPPSDDTFLVLQTFLDDAGELRRRWCVGLAP